MYNNGGSKIEFLNRFTNLNKLLSRFFYQIHEIHLHMSILGNVSRDRKRGTGAVPILRKSERNIQYWSEGEEAGNTELTRFDES